MIPNKRLQQDFYLWGHFSLKTLTWSMLVNNFYDRLILITKIKTLSSELISILHLVHRLVSLIIHLLSHTV